MAISTSMKVLDKLVVFAAIALGFGVIGTSSSQAASINRSDFNADAINFNFESTAINNTTATDGNLTVTNGTTLNVGSVGYISGKSYYDGGDSSVIRFDFLNSVSAFGVDFLANNANINLRIFDKTNNLIDSLTLDWTKLPNAGFPFGFIGLNAGSNLIAYATIDTPLIGNELYIDNIIYQTQTATSVPEPVSALGLLAFGTLGAGSMLKRKQQQKATVKA
ncbi:hypothetical protein ACE1B6_21590 [Aerosakkonemataceae cyanobacterium BLCC-F154]|uniref:PEP-CTERM sorting domain-containing protein n=1 Tax=Floridaenema fluviatile BLCC-F154 TaxID=3153640 RepID=A0ABV4YG89_9CYAN